VKTRGEISPADPEYEAARAEGAGAAWTGLALAAFCFLIALAWASACRGMRLMMPGRSVLKKARPHPGPLPQARVKHLPPLKQNGATDHFSRHEAALATEGTEFSKNAAPFSLSLGERAGVRAGVTSNSRTARIFTHQPSNPPKIP